MKYLVLIFTIALVACGSDGGPAGNGGFRPEGDQAFKGTPSAFDGAWTGTGRGYTTNWEETGLNFKVYITKTPDGADVYYDIREPDGSIFSLGSFTGHFRVGNKLYCSEVDGAVGEIGSLGFHLNRPGTGRVQVVLISSGRIELVGYIEYGPTKVRIEADLRR